DGEVRSPDLLVSSPLTREAGFPPSTAIGALIGFLFQARLRGRRDSHHHLQHEAWQCRQGFQARLRGRRDSHLIAACLVCWVKRFKPAYAGGGIPTKVLYPGK